ncbi:hypothetical protein [Endozoicomonas sp. 8E]|uniref:hypothetical protein n=1 Tax=Endozoicomonas sp. 8E TaxID=3035692 RepID=UPI002938F496|nr:hypothetical protein [Endozoicomonas sp. 8E]WOG28192.1 hypothetical protein P6910_00660 [Endozoicomonas sp. 8E]
MNRRIFLLSYFIILFQIPISYGTITKTSPRDFVVERDGETRQITIESILGNIEYFAEVKHKSSGCPGCRMYLIRTSDGKYYVHHKKNRVEEPGIRNLMLHFSARSQTSGALLFVPGEVAGQYLVPCYQTCLVRKGMQTTPTPNLSQLPNGDYQMIPGPERSVSETMIVGVFEVIEAITF